MGPRTITELETDTMAHNPVNHPLRPLYRVLSAAAGLYLIVFGIAGIIQSPGSGLFNRGDDRVLGQGANLLWAIAALVIGAIVLAVSVLGRNLDTKVNKYLSWGLLVMGTYELAVIRTDANFLDFTISTVIVTYLLGLCLLMSSQYTKVADDDTEAGAPRQVREGRTA
jgi:hypothetical protein